MEEDRGRSAARLLTFTDGVVAIAITLLALPLADIAPESATRPLDVVLQDAAFPFLGFVISFAVIARLWWGHHRIFEHVARWDGWLVYLTVFWLFTVVLLAPVTALVTTGSPTSRSGVAEVAIYIGVMTVSSACLTGLAWHVRRRPTVTDGRDEDAEIRLRAAIATTIGFVLALIIGTTVPGINFYALFVLVLTGRIGGLLRRRGRRTA